MLAVFGSGTLAGLVLFAVQHFTVVPLIQAAETYEATGLEPYSGAPHEAEGWQPAEGWERTSFTALTMVLTGIGFAAMLFGVMALAGETINTRLGALWGLVAFGCVSLAPALGVKSWLNLKFGEKTTPWFTLSPWKERSSVGFKDQYHRPTFWSTMGRISHVQVSTEYCRLW
jgi:MFS family permease